LVTEAASFLIGCLPVPLIISGVRRTEARSLSKSDGESDESVSAET